MEEVEISFDNFRQFTKQTSQGKIDDTSEHYLTEPVIEYTQSEPQYQSACPHHLQCELNLHCHEVVREDAAASYTVPLHHSYAVHFAVLSGDSFSDLSGRATEDWAKETVGDGPMGAPLNRDVKNLNNNGVLTAAKPMSNKQPRGASRLGLVIAILLLACLLIIPLILRSTSS